MISSKLFQAECQYTNTCLSAIYEFHKQADLSDIEQSPPKRSENEQNVMHASYLVLDYI